MEHNEMDKLFRDIINNDKSELKEEEIISKENIWNELDVPNRKRKFHFWKIAAVILFFLWGGTAWFFTNKINQEKQFSNQLEKSYDEVKNSLSSIQIQLEQTKINTKGENLEPNISDIKEEFSTIPTPEKEIIEKLVFVNDTIFINESIPLEQLVQVIKDTVFIEVPIQAPIKISQNENEKEIPNEKNLKEKMPSKIEFVFGKKPLKKPTQQNKLIIINENEVAKKTNKTNSNLISIPIKN